MCGILHISKSHENHDFLTKSSKNPIFYKKSQKYQKNRFLDEIAKSSRIPKYRYFDDFNDIDDSQGYSPCSIR
jgi:hypothetical protein